MALATGTAILAGSLIAGGAGIGGGILSNRSNRKLTKEAQKFQEDFAKKGIRWRVRDAKKAGIHPLYAMGAQTQSASPALIGDSLGDSISQAGQHIGGAVGKLPGRQELKENNLRLKLLESQIGEADARKNLFNSEAARNKQNQVSKVAGANQQLGVMNENGVSLPNQKASRASSGFTIPPDPVFIYESDLNKRTSAFPPSLSDLPGAGLIEKKPAEVTTHKKGNRGLVAGEHPAFKEYRLPTGLPIMLPAGDTLSEVLEETPMWMYKSIYELNKRKYGPEWADAFLEFLWSGGHSPDTKAIKRSPSPQSRNKAKGWLD